MYNCILLCLELPLDGIAHKSVMTGIKLEGNFDSKLLTEASPEYQALTRELKLAVFFFFFHMNIIYNIFFSYTAFLNIAHRIRNMFL